MNSFLIFNSIETNSYTYVYLLSSTTWTVEMYGLLTFYEKHKNKIICQSIQLFVWNISDIVPYLDK